MDTRNLICTLLLLLLSGVLFGQEAAPAADAGAATRGMPVAAEPPADVPVTERAEPGGADAEEDAALAHDRTAVPGGASARLSPIERVFANRLPEGAAVIRQYGYDFLRRSRPVTAGVGDDYELGPGDSLLIYLWGDIVTAQGDRAVLDGLSAAPGAAGPSQLNRYETTVDRDGYLFYPPVGRLYVAGNSLSSVSRLITERMRPNYRGFNLDLTVGELRTFPVMVTGFVERPGVVYLTSLSTLIEALAAAGGVSNEGTLRDIVVRRSTAGREETLPVDLYDLLMEGRARPLRVREGDVVFVPPIGDVVGIAGEVTRPGIYELKGEHSVEQVLSLAGALLPAAARQRIAVIRSDGERLLLVQGSLSDSRFLAETTIVDGDLLHIRPTSNLLANTVEIAGEVVFPGRYPVETVPTLRDLLEKSEILATTNQFYGELVRVDEDGRREYRVFTPRRIMDAEEDILLRPADVVRLFAYGDIQSPDFDRFSDVVLLRGHVKYPGVYALWDGMMVSDLVTRNSILLNTNLAYSTIERIDTWERGIVSFAPGDVLAETWDEKLKSFDTVTLFADAVRQPVRVGGQVEHPSMVPFYEGLSLLDVLRYVDIADEPANLKADLYRLDRQTDREVHRDTVYFLDLLIEGREEANLTLSPGDHIVIQSVRPRERDRSVEILGEVRKPGIYSFSQGQTLSDLIRQAGGYTDHAFASAMVITRESARRVQIDSLARAVSAIESAAVRMPAGALGTAAQSEGLAAAEEAAYLQTRARALRDVLERNRAGFGRVVVDVPATLTELERSEADIPLEAGDSVFVPREPYFVAVVGDVYNQVVLTYQRTSRIEDYLSVVGGLRSSADRQDLYVIKYSGRILNERSLPGGRMFNNIMRQRLDPGDTIVVPPKINMASGWAVFRELLSTATASATLALTTYGLLAAAGVF